MHSQTQPISSCFHTSVPAHSISGISQNKSTTPVSVSQLHTLHTQSALSPQYTDNSDAPTQMKGQAIFLLLKITQDFSSLFFITMDTLCITELSSSLRPSSMGKHGKAGPSLYLGGGKCPMVIKVAWLTSVQLMAT